MAVVYVNTSGQTRVWPHLTDPDTGQTLELAAGESVELDLPDGFEDPHLQPAASSPASRAPSSSAGSETPDPAHDEPSQPDSSETESDSFTPTIEGEE